MFPFERPDGAAGVLARENAEGGATPRFAAQEPTENLQSSYLTGYRAGSAIQRDIAVTTLRGAKRTDSAISQFPTPAMAMIFPAIRAR